MKLFKVQKTDLKLDGEYYNEGESYEFDEKKKDVKKLVAAGILVGAKGEEKSEEKEKTKAETKAEEKEKAEAETKAEAEPKTETKK
jgi:hypothetical protein